MSPSRVKGGAIPLKTYLTYLLDVSLDIHDPSFRKGRLYMRWPFCLD